MIRADPPLQEQLEQVRAELRRNFLRRFEHDEQRLQRETLPTPPGQPDQFQQLRTDLQQRYERSFEADVRQLDQQAATGQLGGAASSAGGAWDEPSEYATPTSEAPALGAEVMAN